MREQAHAFAQEEATRAAQEKAAADKAAAAAAAAAAASSEAQLVAKAEDEAAADFFKDGVIDAAATPQAPQETLQVPQEEEVLCSPALLPTCAVGQLGSMPCCQIVRPLVVLDWMHWS